MSVLHAPAYYLRIFVGCPTKFENPSICWLSAWILRSVTWTRRFLFTELHQSKWPYTGFSDVGSEPPESPVLSKFGSSEVKLLKTVFRQKSVAASRAGL